MAGDDVGEWPCTELPASWYWADFVTFFADHTDSQRKVSQKSYKQHGLIAVVDQGASKIGGFTNDLSMQSQAPLPAIVFGDHTRAVKYIDIPFAQGADGVRVLTARENVEPAFAYQALRCIKLPDKGYSRHFKFLKASRFPLAPLPEQRRIVAKIDSLTGKSRRARDHLDHIPRLVEKYKQAILAAAFRGDLTREWRGLASKDDIEWEIHELGDIADIGTGATPKRGRADYYEGGTIAWVTSGAVNDGIIAHADECITPTALNETNCKIYPAGTLLMAMYGEGKTRGKVATLGIDAATNQALAAIQVHHQGPASPQFVLWYLRSQYLSLRDQAAGGVQPNLNLGIIKRTCIDLPSSSEQGEIVRRIESAFAWIDRLAADATSARKLIDHLDQSVLAKAFKGELVPQDPADEPASALLDRIRAERTASPEAKRGSKKAA